MELLLLIVLAFPLAGFFYERSAATRDAQQNAEPLGDLYTLPDDVGGYKVHALIAGAGPTVVLLPGIGGSSLDWLPVHQQADDFAQVIAYDRAGYNWSDTGNHKPTPDHIVQELHALLQAANIAGPVILVGHSLGGLLARLYQATYPDDVAGLVLVDASHPEYVAERDNSKEIGRLRRVNIFKQIGLLRVLIRRVIDQRLERLPDDVRDAYAAMSVKNTPATFREARAVFAYDFSTLPTQLGALPLVVLSRQPTELASDQRWQGYQQDLQTLAADALYVESERYHHDVHMTEPQFVIDAIQHVIERSASA